MVTQSLISIQPEVSRFSLYLYARTVFQCMPVQGYKALWNNILWLRLDLSTDHALHVISTHGKQTTDSSARHLLGTRLWFSRTFFTLFISIKQTSMRNMTMKTPFLWHLWLTRVIELRLSYCCPIGRFILSYLLAFMARNKLVASRLLGIST